MNESPHTGYEALRETAWKTNGVDEAEFDSAWETYFTEVLERSGGNEAVARQVTADMLQKLLTGDQKKQLLDFAMESKVATAAELAEIHNALKVESE
jgi:3-methyladenine DNA glycosylase AlkD